MKGLISCFAVFCLSLASGAPSAEIPFDTFYSQGVVLNNSSYPIFSQNFLQNGEMIYAVCENTPLKLEKKCKIYADVGRDIIKSCDLNLNFTWDQNYHYVTLFGGGNSKAVFVSREDEYNVLLTSVDFKDCQTAEARIPVPITKSEHLRKEVYVVLNEKNYEVIYRSHDDTCGRHYCKATFDYDGTVNQEVLAFPVVASDFGIQQIEYANGSLLVSEFFLDVVNVYLYRGDFYPRTFSYFNSKGVGLSVGANKFGHCVTSDWLNSRCTQYDFDGKTKIAEFDLNKGNSSRLVYNSLLNVEKGILALAYGQISDIDDDKNDHLFVVHYDENGKQGKYIKIEPGCNKRQFDQPMKLYKNSKGEYCAFTACFAAMDSKLQTAKVYRHETCIRESKLF